MVITYTYSEKPVFYESSIASFLTGDDVPNLMLYDEDKQFVKFQEYFNLYYFTLTHFLKIISRRTDNLEHLAKLIHHALSYESLQRSNFFS